MPGLMTGKTAEQLTLVFKQTIMRIMNNLLIKQKTIMKKSLLAMTALAAMLFAGCTSSDEITTLESIKQAENAPTAIEFGTYMGRTGTRAGWEGDITNTELKSSSAANGFGVFAYYTGIGTYNDKNGAHDATGKIAPNFMYNEHIYWDGTSKWKYDNIKYWPNEIQNGSVDVPGASTPHANGGKVSFFAYAPYVETASASVIAGTFNQGVLSTATAVSPRPVSDRSSWPIDILSNAAPTPTAYRLNGDLVKQENDGTVGFAFKHALSKVGGTSTADPTNEAGLKIVLDADAITAANAANNTVITVEDIKITTLPMTYLDNDGVEQSGGDARYITGGVFNLATGKWTVNVSTDPTNAIVHELTTSGTGVSGSLNTDIAEPTSVTSMSGTPSLKVNGSVPGVTGTLTPVYGSSTSPMLFIPGCKPKFNIDITYYVRSYDSKLNADAASGGEGTWTKVKQVITKTIEFANYTELNKRYTLVIHLGITSVKFTAEVSAWDDNSTPIGPGSGNTNVINLPLNVN